MFSALDSAVEQPLLLLLVLIVHLVKEIVFIRFSPWVNKSINVKIGLIYDVMNFRATMSDRGPSYTFELSGSFRFPTGRTAGSTRRLVVVSGVMSDRCETSLCVLFTTYACLGLEVVSHGNDICDKLVTHIHRHTYSQGNICQSQVSPQGWESPTCECKKFSLSGTQPHRLPRQPSHFKLCSLLKCFAL